MHLKPFKSRLEHCSLNGVLKIAFLTAQKNFEVKIETVSSCISAVERN